VDHRNISKYDLLVFPAFSFFLSLGLAGCGFFDFSFRAASKITSDGILQKSWTRLLMTFVDKVGALQYNKDNSYLGRRHF
jgi:hypothetical protein